MSSGKVRKVKRILDFTSTWATNLLTVTTSTAHFLTTGDIVQLQFPVVPQEMLGATVTVTGANTFTVVTTQTNIIIGKVVIDFFGPTQSGRTVITSPRSVGTDAVIQSWVTGTNGVTYQVEGSLDGIHFTNIGAATVHTAGTTLASTVTPNWAYLAINITVAVGAATKLEILYSA